jgi:integrase
LSPTTVRYAYSVLRIALGRAMKAGTVARNVATLVDPPAKAPVELAPLSADQVRELLASLAGDRLEALYVAAVGTGLRQGELLALRWEDVDLEAGTVTVRHTLDRRTKELAEPKTHRGRRTVHLSSRVLAALHDHRRAQLAERLAAGPAWRDRDLVFTTPTGRPLDSANVTHAFRRVLERATLPHQRFHDLRHAYATLMLEAGEELAVVSRSLGHADLSTTADIYAHLTPAMLRRSAERMDGILGERRAAR